MAAPGQEMTAYEEGEGMGNKATSFAIIGGGGGDGPIQTAQRQRWSIALQGHGVQWAGPIKQ
jgi:hypothetical protein